MRFSFYSLRTGVLAHLVFLIVSAMLLINMVMVKFSERDLIEAKLQTGRLLLNSISQKLGDQLIDQRRSWTQLESDSGFKKEVNQLLRAGGFSGALVVKKDGGRERLDRNKILSGLLKACEKRPVSLTQLEKIVDKVEQTVQESPERELDSVTIGKILLSELKRMDKVAYLRFASVYLEFEDVNEFMTEINELFEKK